MHSRTLTALKSDFEKVSKSTISSNSGSTLTFEKSIFSSASLTSSLLPSFFSAPIGFIVGKSIASLMLGASAISIIALSIPIPSPPVGGIPTSRAFTKSISIG